MPCRLLPARESHAQERTVVGFLSMLNAYWRSFFVPLFLGLGLLLTGCPSASAPPGEKAGSGSSGTKRLMFVTNGDDPFWDALLSGLNEGAKQEKLAEAGLSVHRDVNNGTIDGQVEQLRQYSTQDDIAGVAISVIGADNLATIEEMRKLQKKGVKLITVDSDVSRSDFRDARSFYIGTDNVVGGRALGTATKALLEAKGIKTGGYVQYAGFTDVDNARGRMNGVKETIGAAYKELDRMPDDMNLNKARDNVRNAIQNHPDLVAHIGIWAYNAPAIADVVKETGTRDKYVVATFDAQDLAIAAMEQGQIDAMVVQNPFDMGVQTVRLLKAMIKDDQATIKKMFPNQGKDDGDIYTTGLRVVVPEKNSPINPDLFDPKVVEYMRLPDFKAWLSKYGLHSS
jgi:ribose transport system substrate-binding protein